MYIKWKIFFITKHLGCYDGVNKRKSSPTYIQYCWILSLVLFAWIQWSVCVFLYSTVWLCCRFSRARAWLKQCIVARRPINPHQVFIWQLSVYWSWSLLNASGLCNYPHVRKRRGNLSSPALDLTSPQRTHIIYPLPLHQWEHSLFMMSVSVEGLIMVTGGAETKLIREQNTFTKRRHETWAARHFSLGIMMYLNVKPVNNVGWDFICRDVIVKWKVRLCCYRLFSRKSFQ